MYSVFIKYQLPTARKREDVLEIFKKSEAKFRAVPKLIRKYFAYDEKTHTGHSVYLWPTEQDARAFFNDAFLKSFEATFATKPELFYVDTLMVVDNEQGKTSF